MNNNRPKQILDSTFRHLEEVLEEMRQERKKKERILMAGRQAGVKEKKTVHVPESTGNSNR